MQIGITSPLGLPLQAWRQDIQYLVANNIFKPKSINHDCQCLGQQLGSPMDPNPFIATLTTPRSGHIKAGSRLGKLLDHGFRTKSNTTILGQSLVLNKKILAGVFVFIWYSPLCGQKFVWLLALYSENVWNMMDPLVEPLVEPFATGFTGFARPVLTNPGLELATMHIPCVTMHRDAWWTCHGWWWMVHHGHSWHLPVTVKESSSQ